MSLRFAAVPVAGQEDDTTVNWELDAGNDGISDSDMIVLVEAGCSDASNYITYGYASGDASGSVDISLGYYMEPGKDYEVRYVDPEYNALASIVVGAGGSGGGAAEGEAADSAVAAAAADTPAGDEEAPPAAGPGITDADIDTDAEAVIQKIGELLLADKLADVQQAADTVQMYGATHPNFAADNYDAICAMLISVKGIEFGEAGELAYDDPKCQRLTHVTTFFTMVTMPAYTDIGNYGSRILPAVMAYLALPGLDMFKAQISGVVSMIPMQAPELMVPQLDLVFDAVKAGNVALLGGMMQLYDTSDESRAAFERNLDVLIGAAEDPTYGMMVPSIFWNISKNKPGLFLPHLDMFVNKSSTAGGMMYFYAMGEIAYAHPAEVYPHLEALSGSYMGMVESTDDASKASLVWAFAKILAGCGTLSTAHAAQMLATIAELLTEPAVVASDPILCFIVKECGQLSTADPQGMLGPYMGTIRQIAGGGGTAGEAAQRLVARDAGEDVDALHDRLDEVEKKIEEMNGNISETCQDMDQVKAYVDANIAEVKDFIGEIVKKLPNPVRFSIGQDSWRKGGKKVLKLHFVCSHGSGVEWTTETREWGKWMKMGFALVNTGKAALELGTNPLGLVATGVREFKGVYDAFKQEDSEDFDKYISKPFLTSAERDKLIVQLRESGFFEKFVYDAQKGDWYVPTAEERAALDAKKPAVTAAAAAGATARSAVPATAAAAAAGGGTTAASPPVAATSLLSKKNKDAFKAASAPKLEPLVIVEWTRPTGSGEAALSNYLGDKAGTDALAHMLKEFSEPPFPAGDELMTKAEHLMALLSSTKIVSDPALSSSRKDCLDSVYNCVLMLPSNDAKARVLDRCALEFLSYAALVACECPSEAGSKSVEEEARAAVNFVLQVANMIDATKQGAQAGSKWLDSQKQGWACGVMEKLCSANFAADTGRAAPAVLTCILDNLPWTPPPGPPVEAAPVLFKIFERVPSIAAKERAATLMELWKTYSADVDFAEHAEKIFAVMDQGYAEACTANKLVPALNPRDEMVATGLMSRIGLLVQMAEDNKDQAWQYTGRGVGSVLLQLAVERKTATIRTQLPFVLDTLEDCTREQEKMLFDVLVTVGSTRADIVYPMLLDLQDVMATADTGATGVGQCYAAIIGDCGALSLEHTREVLPLLLREVRKVDLPAHPDAAAYLSEIGRLCHGRKQLLEMSLAGDLLGPPPSDGGDGRGTETTLLEVCRRWNESADGKAAAAAELVLAHYEGRDAEAMAARVKALEAQCEETNAAIAKACSDFEQVRTYMEENVAQLKGFIAEVAKKLPNPSKFSVVSGKMTKKIKLHFVCPKTGYELCTESSDWSKWVKVGFGLVSLGKAVLDVGLGNPFGLIGKGAQAFSGLYGHMKNKDDADFNKFISEPFLTSEEQDRLIGGLKKAKFFDEFDYDAQLGDWCKKGATVDKAAAAAAAAASAAADPKPTSADDDSDEPAGAALAALAAPFVPLATLARERVRAAAEAAALPDSARVAAESAGSGKIGVEKWLAKSTGVADVGTLLDCTANGGDEEACKTEVLQALGLTLGYHDPAVALGTFGHTLAILAHPKTAQPLLTGVAEAWMTYFIQETPDGQLEVLRSVPAAHFYSVVAHCMTTATDSGGLDAATNLLTFLPILLSTKTDEYMDRDTTVAIIGMLATIQTYSPASAEQAEAEAAALGAGMGYWAEPICKKRKLLKMLIPVVFAFWGARGDVGTHADLLHNLFSECLAKAMEFSPKLLAPHVEDVFAMLEPQPNETSAPAYRTDGTIAKTLSQLYRYDKQAFGTHIPQIIECWKSAGAMYKPQWVMVIADMCKGPIVARRLLPFVDTIVAEAEATKLGRYMMIKILEDCAKSVDAAAGAADDDLVSNPLLPLLPRIKTLCLQGGLDGDANINSYINCVSACGLTDREELPAMMTELLAVLQLDKSADVNSMCLTMMVDMRPTKDIVEPLIEQIKPLEKEGSTKVNGQGREAAHVLVQVYEGRDLGALVQRVAAIDRKMHDLNANMKEMCSNMDEVEKYVQDNIADVKQFLGTVAKKLPTPAKLTVDGKLRKSLKLHFVCARTGYEHITVTKTWNKWLKMGFTLAQAGSAVIEAVGEGDAGAAAAAAGKAAKSIYDSFKDKDDADFNTYISEPFLMSNDRDKLLAQLEESDFFSVFAYDPQIAAWVRKAEDEVVTADGMIMQKPRDDAPTDDPVVQAYAKAAAAAEGSKPHSKSRAESAGDQQWGFWATKRGHIIPSWRRRWFVCHPAARKVVYWQSESVATAQVGARPKGVIRIGIGCIEAGNDQAHNLVIATDKSGKKPKKYYLRCEKPEDVERLLRDFGHQRTPRQS